MQSLDIISVNLWQIVVSLLNLLILLLIIKRYLFEPVARVLDARRNSIEGQYSDAELALNNAKESERELNSRLKEAHVTADGIIREATVLAENRKESIVNDAQKEASLIVRRAKLNAELEKKKAASEIKEQIISVSYALTKKLIEREIKAEDHRNLINAFISEMGEIGDGE